MQVAGATTRVLPLARGRQAKLTALGLVEECARVNCERKRIHVGSVDGGFAASDSPVHPATAPTPAMATSRIGVNLIVVRVFLAV
jgi:hypothetical protein